MADKYIRQNGGALQEVEGLTSSAGAGDAGKIPALDGAGRLDSSMMPVGVGADTATIQASENLSSGDLVNIWDDTGSRARKADATDTSKPAVGFVLAGVTSGQNATVYFEGRITGLSGLTPGAEQYLDTTTAGGVTETAPSTAGNIVQFVGRAIDETTIAFEPARPIELA